MLESSSSCIPGTLTRNSSSSFLFPKENLTDSSHDCIIKCFDLGYVMISMTKLLLTKQIAQGCCYSHAIYLSIAYNPPDILLESVV